MTVLELPSRDLLGEALLDTTSTPVEIFLSIHKDITWKLTCMSNSSLLPVLHRKPIIRVSYDVAFKHCAKEQHDWLQNLGYLEFSSDCGF